MKDSEKAATGKNCPTVCDGVSHDHYRTARNGGHAKGVCVGRSYGRLGCPGVLCECDRGISSDSTTEGTMSDKKYQWDYPLEWLEEKINGTNDPEVLRDYALTLARSERMDSDSIQDLFQSDIDADGYFETV